MNAINANNAVRRERCALWYDRKEKSQKSAIHNSSCGDLCAHWTGYTQLTISMCSYLLQAWFKLPVLQWLYYYGVGEA